MKIFKSALVLTLVGLLCGLLIGGTNAITAPIIKENQFKLAKKAYEEFFPELDDMDITEIDGDYVYEYVRLTKEGNILGYAFRVNGVNQRGAIDLVVAASPTGKIEGIKILSTDNTPGYYDKYEGSDKNLIGIIGDTLDTLEGIDNIGGATQTGDTLNAMLQEVSKVAEEVIEEVTELEMAFGLGATATEDMDFNKTDIVIKREIVKDKAGNVVGYTYTGSLNSDKIPNVDDANLTLLVMISKSGEVKSLTTVNREHTPGFYDKYNKEFEAVKGLDIKDLEIDGIANSTVSFGIITEILEAIKEAVTLND